jgi:hypothetical protein
MSYYDLLGVKPGATHAQIRSAYRVLAQLFHPDRLQQLKPEAREFAEERLKALNQAYEVLGDPARRADYDARLSAAEARPAPHPPASRRAPPEPYAPDPPINEGAARRAAALERNQRRAELERQIAELDRSLRILKMESDRMHTDLRADEAQARRRFWGTVAISGLGFWSVMAAGIVIFTLPVRLPGGLAQLAVFVSLAVLYELASAYILARALAGQLTRASLAPVALASLRALLVSSVLGMLGWAGWRLTFFEANSLGALAVLAGVFLAAHTVFCGLVMGGFLRVADEQRRLYDHNTNQVMQTYRDQLMLARAQRAALDLETA